MGCKKKPENDNLPLSRVGSEAADGYVHPTHVFLSTKDKLKLLVSLVI